MLRIKQAIIVEGRYDKIRLSNITDAVVICTNGFSIYKDREKQELIKSLAAKTGIIILTDSDSAGFQIRSFIRSIVKQGEVLNAVTPDILGKERRKAVPGKEGLLGVEGMTPEILLKALRNAGAEFEDGSAPSSAKTPITKQDLFVLGLSGGPESTKKRAALLSALSLPAHMSANALLQALNVLFSHDEFFSQAHHILDRSE